MSVDTIRVAFVLAELNNLGVMAADISTAFLHGRTCEKVYNKAGPEFGKFAGRILLFDGCVYGLKSSAARFHEHLAF